MTKNLVIVESPSKTKPIEKYLGSDYKVLSSKGHVRDLATTGKYGFGVDVDHDFKPNYIMMSGKKNVVNELKKALKDASHVYLATDPDREGEAISWHLKDVLNLDDKDYDRVVFNEITKNAVVDAFKHTRKIDDYLVNSQETRRIVDRIIGFRLSKLIQSKTNGSSAGRVQSVALKLIVEKEREIEAFNHTRKIDFDLVKSQETRRILDRIIGFRLSTFLRNKKYGQSVGRVQSVALKIIIDKEREIQAFVPEDYFVMFARLAKGNDIVTAKFYGDKNGKMELKDEKTVNSIIKKIDGKDYEVTDVKKSERRKNPPAPFTTSSLQQEASRKLGFGVKKTMMVAQRLYEHGFSTYMRTDSTRLS